MREVGHIVPALPVPVVSTALLAAGEAGLSDLQLDDAVCDLMRRLKSVGAYVLTPSHGQRVGEVGLRMLMRRQLVTGESWRLPVEPRRNSLACLLRQFHCPPAGGGVGLLRTVNGTREKRTALQRFRQITEIFLPCGRDGRDASC